MTDKHPLTDDIIAEIAHGRYIDDYGHYSCVEDDMRKVTDWQLEQVLEWLQDNVSHSLLIEITDKKTPYPNTSENSKSVLRLDLDWIVEDLKKAMRPTTQEDNVR